MSAVDAYVDEMSRKGMAEIRKEAKDAGAKGGKARRADG
jgi:diacylglycerol kinase